MSTSTPDSIAQGVRRQALAQLIGVIFIVQEIPLTPSLLDHGYYSTYLDIDAPITGWGRLAALPTEVIFMILEQCTIKTLLSVMLVNRGALEFVLSLPGFDRVLGTLLVHIEAVKVSSSPSPKDFLATMNSRTYTHLNALTRVRECHICGCGLVGIPVRLSPKAVTICSECSDELGSGRFVDLNDCCRLMDKRGSAQRIHGCVTVQDTYNDIS